MLLEEIGFSIILHGKDSTCLGHSYFSIV